MVVAMVQSDVADRLAAAPGTHAYGSLSVAVQYAMHVERVLRLNPRDFYPAPKVVSTVVRLVRRSIPAVQSARSRALSEGRAWRLRVPAQNARQLSRTRARSPSNDDRGGRGGQPSFSGATR